MFKLEPKFENLEKDENLKTHVKKLIGPTEPIPHSLILEQLKEQYKELDFQALAFPLAAELKSKLKKVAIGSEQESEIKSQLSKFKVNQKHFLILAVENILLVAESNKWGLCKNHEFIYLYNETFWKIIDKEIFQRFLGEAAEKMGVIKFTSRYYQFKEQLFKQFISTAYIPVPEIPRDKVLINLKNGTFEVTSEGVQIRPFERDDFLTYQLPFEYSPDKKANLFQSYLDRVLPDKQRQLVLAEYLGYIFIKHNSNALKEEKALILYGTGANGKSVFFEIVNAMLGANNISSYSLQDLTDVNGYYRAMIANKLVNYASEINGKLEASIFKQMVSGETITGRLPYGQPMQLEQYAKLIFNCNELPRDVENTKAFFRRFLIIPFDITIPEEEQDKQLHTKIIQKEMSGVFNWVLEGLDRLLKQKRFSNCEAATQAVNQYEKQSDSVKMFVEENEYEISASDYIRIKELYSVYRSFCIEDGFKPVNKTNFIKRLQGYGIPIERKNTGNVAYLSK